MQRSVFLFDIDDTCYNGFSQGDLMKAEVAAGFYSQQELAGIIADIKEKYHEKEPYEQLAEAYVHDMATLLAGKNRQALYRHARDFFGAHQDKLNDFLPALLTTYSATHDSYFISCGLDYSVQAIADLMQLTGYVATTLKTIDGVYQNEITIDLSKASDKATQAKTIMERYPLAGSVAFGDSIADAGMMRHTQYGVCVAPKPDLAAAAQQNGWQVVPQRTAVVPAVKALLG